MKTLQNDEINAFLGKPIVSPKGAVRPMTAKFAFKRNSVNQTSQKLANGYLNSEIKEDMAASSPTY